MHKAPGWLWDTIDRWMKTCESKLEAKNIPTFFQKFKYNDLTNEVKWLKKRLEEEKCPVVFCHNDMQEGNILIRRDGTDNNNAEDAQIVIIGQSHCIIVSMVNIDVYLSSVLANYIIHI